ncbi:sulfotransferase 1 family member D1-like [Sergentomyia squamirostris]
MSIICEDVPHSDLVAKGAYHDYKTAGERPLTERFPFIEFGSILSRDLKIIDEEMVWLIANDLDYEKVKTRCQEERFPFLEINSLLSKNITIPNVIIELMDYLSFEKFSVNSSVNQEESIAITHKEMNFTRPDSDYRFIRKGQVGSFKTEMPQAMIDTFNKWITEEVNKVLIDSGVLQIFVQDELSN